MKTDFQALVDSMAAMTCVVSVEKLDDGSCGTIRIVTGNRSYIDSIEKPHAGAEMLTKKFVPNSEYTDYLTRDLNFEDFCYRSAVQKKCLHSYAHPNRMDIWFNMMFMPLDADEGNLSFCTYTMEISFQPSTEHLSNVPGDIASHVLESAIKLSSYSDFETAMAEVVGDIRRECAAEYCCVLLVDDDEQTCSVLAENIAEGSSLLPMNAHIHDDFYDIVESWEDAISGSNCIIAKNDRDMDVVRERNPRWHESLIKAGVASIALFPLKSHNQLLGYIWAVNFDPENAGKIKGTLELATYVLAAEIDNYLLMDRMRVLSSRDMLTGVMNRNEMNGFVDRLSNGEEGAGKSIGIVFVDLNGLKTINDEEGHSAGDKLLKDGSRALMEVFDAETIFRAGGDEFVVLSIGAVEDEIAEKVGTLKRAQAHYDKVSFAIGSCVEADGKDVRRGLRVADERMYDDKKAYYKQFPERKRSRGSGE